MNVKKLKIIKAGINSLLVSVLALAAIYAGANPVRVTLAAIAVIGALGGVEWGELPAVKLVQQKPNETEDDEP